MMAQKPHRNDLYGPMFGSHVGGKRPKPKQTSFDLKCLWIRFYLPSSLRSCVYVSERFHWVVCGLDRSCFHHITPLPKKHQTNPILSCFYGADSWRGEEVQPHSESGDGDSKVRLHLTFLVLTSESILRLRITAFRWREQHGQLRGEVHQMKGSGWETFSSHSDINAVNIPMFPRPF